MRRKSQIRRRVLLFPTITFVLVGLLLLISQFYILDTPSWTFNWTGIRPEIRDSVKLDRGDYFGRYVCDNFYNRHCLQYQNRREWVMQNATNQELVKLMNHPEPIIKAMAHEGLLRKENTDHYWILESSFIDTTTFLFTTNGHDLPMLIGDYLIERVLCVSDRIPMPAPSNQRPLSSNLTDEELIKILKLYNYHFDKKQVYYNAYFK